MAIAAFIVLGLIMVPIIVYPLFRQPDPIPRATAVTDREIDLAVRRLRRGRQKGSLPCPSCGNAVRAGDRFCVRCGDSLPGDAATVRDELTCPNCGALIQGGDEFCAKCGRRLAAGEMV